MNNTTINHVKYNIFQRAFWIYHLILILLRIVLSFKYIMTRKVFPSIIYISIIHCMRPSICVAAFVTAPHKLPSAYMTFLLRHSGIYRMDIRIDNNLAENVIPPHIGQKVLPALQ